MGISLSKFQHTEHIQWFQGKLIEDGSEEENDLLDQEGTTFFSDLYVYKDIVTMSSDSE